MGIFTYPTDEDRPEFLGGKPAGEVVRVAPEHNPLDPVPVVQELEIAYREHIEGIRSEVEAMVVVDDITSARANEMTLQAKRLFAQIEKRQKQVTEPAHVFKSRIDRACKALKDALLVVAASADRKRLAYMQEQDRKRREAEAAERARVEDALRKAREESERVAAEARAKAVAEGKAKEEADAAARIAAQQQMMANPVPVAPSVPAKTVEVTDSGTTTLETALVAKLVNVSLLSEACLAARWAQIEAAVMPWANAQLKAGIRNLPGFVVTDEPVLKTRIARK